MEHRGDDAMACNHATSHRHARPRSTSWSCGAGASPYTTAWFRGSGETTVVAYAWSDEVVVDPHAQTIDARGRGCDGPRRSVRDNRPAPTVMPSVYMCRTAWSLPGSVVVRSSSAVRLSSSVVTTSGSSSCWPSLALDMSTGSHDSCHVSLASIVVAWECVIVLDTLIILHRNSTT